MTKHTYAILGATGQIGQVLSRELLKLGHKVRAIGRNKEKLQHLKELGAETYQIAFDDAAALAKAFQGVNAVFSFVPPAPDSDDLGSFQDKVGEAIVQALIAAKVTHVLNLSSIGAQLPNGTGPIKGLFRQESRLNALSSLNVLHLRPGFFMENLNFSIPTIKATGHNASTLRADLGILMVSTMDIGLKAAELLHALKFTGHSVFEYVGPHAITMSEATALLGKAIGKPGLKYVQLTNAEAEKGMLAHGMKLNSVKLMLEMNQAFNENKISLTQKLSAENKGHTSFEDFTKTFSRTYLSAETTRPLAHSHS